MKEGCVGRVFRGGTRCMRREAAQNPEGLLHKVTGESYVRHDAPEGNHCHLAWSITGSERNLWVPWKILQWLLCIGSGVWV